MTRHYYVLSTVTPKILIHLPPLLGGLAACVVHREEWYTKQVGSLGKDLKVQWCLINDCPAKKEGRGFHEQ